MKPVFKSVAFGVLTPHPARASAMRDDGGHPAYVSDWIAAGEFANAGDAFATIGDVAVQAGDIRDDGPQQWQTSLDVIR